jgi:hypothetical protein
LLPFSQLSVHFLELIGLEDPSTRGKELKHTETDEDFLLNANHEPRLEEDQHKEVNDEGWNPLANEERQVVLHQVHGQISVRVPEPS